jgi:hypothetical protein
MTLPTTVTYYRQELKTQNVYNRMMIIVETTMAINLKQACLLQSHYYYFIFKPPHYHYHYHYYYYYYYYYLVVLLPISLQFDDVTRSHYTFDDMNVVYCFQWQWRTSRLQRKFQ